ncbi:phosphatidylglycerol lysyltransferase domain-containing protein [Pseudoclostridium thermosuccinogenes]|uniref:DUF2156 domain-containing protein n=1 Tax=Clostridium thermosuccinogenes TaxID=84032 RepID=UPI002FD8E0EF
MGILMMDFSEINISDKQLFDKYIKESNPQASELTFTNFFMWRDYYKFRYALAGDLLCVVSADDKKGPFAFAPIGSYNDDNFTEALAAIKEYFNKKGWALRFSRVTEKELPYFKKSAAVKGDFIEDRDNSDYVYLTENLINLSGKKYDGKRNHIKRFKKQYEYEYVILGPEHVDECSRIMLEWCKSRDCGCQRGEYCERHANMELLQNYEVLGCKGAIIKVDGRFEAFTVGEMLNSDTAVIHTEKANSAIHGLYTFINQQFCEHEWKDTMYINREQDLGIEGIRKAKLSYNPVMMIRKYNIL